MIISLWSFIGLGAALLTSTSFVPQLFLQLKNPAHARVSYLTLFQFSLGALLWTGYGIHLHDWIIIAANLFILANLLAIAAVQWVRDLKQAH